MDVLSQPITEEEDEREVSADADTCWLNACTPTGCGISLSRGDRRSLVKVGGLQLTWRPLRGVVVTVRVCVRRWRT